MTTIEALIESVREDVRCEAKYLRENAQPEELLRELADQGVPVYHRDLAEALMGDHSLAYPDEPSLAGDPPDAWKLLQVSIYERLLQAARDEWEAIQAADDEDDTE